MRADPSIAHRKAAIARLLRLAGGAKRAADLIEYAALAGPYSPEKNAGNSDAAALLLVPADHFFPWYAYYRLDEAAFWGVLLLVFYKLLCSMRRSGAQCVDRQQQQQQGRKKRE